MDTPAGMLFSRIGYNLEKTKRAVIRGAENSLSDKAYFSLQKNGVEVYKNTIKYFGELWGSHWWIADFSTFNKEGEYSLLILDNNSPVENYPAETLRIGKNILWEQTWEAVSLEQCRKRQRFAYKQEDTGKNLGWLDAGMPWQEANSHAALLYGLCDLGDKQLQRINKTHSEELYGQLINGADYLASLQNLAESKRLGEGALVHQIFDHDAKRRAVPFYDLVLPGDVAKAAAAFARVSEALPQSHAVKKEEYRKRAHKALDWMLNKADYTSLPFLPFPHAVSDDYKVPDVIPTPDLALLVWTALILEDKRVFALAEDWLSRQITQDNAADGKVYGHFGIFNSSEPTERAWYHGVGNEGMGFNNGNTFGALPLPLIALLKKYPEHSDAPEWKEALRNFTYGYFIPGCLANPFMIVPNGYYAGEGYLWFAGLWHGANIIYGNAAALSMELAEIFADNRLKDIAEGNMQWIAGLNAGLTAEAVEKCHVFSMDIPRGRAIPCSMIHGIGDISMGCWLNWRGAITNGFSTGEQFVWDVEPRKKYDSPGSLTDEDWISHAGGWLSGLSRTTPLYR